MIQGAKGSSKIIIQLRVTFLPSMHAYYIFPTQKSSLENKQEECD